MTKATMQPVHDAAQAGGAPRRGRQGAGPSGWQVTGVIWRREMIRFRRQPIRVAAALGTALLLWLVMGSGMAESFLPRSAGPVSYAAFMLPGMMTLVAMFTAVFSSITVIEERNEGWLQSVLVSPAPRWGIALGKMAGGATVAWAQAALLLPAAWWLGLHVGVVMVVQVLAALLAACLALAAVGLLFAWRCETTAAFHAVMNLVFMPMWILSGAMFPVPRLGGISSWLAGVMWINPLTWCTQAIRAPMVGQPSLPWLAASVGFAAVMLGLAIWTVARGSRRLT